jgi:hypothetical protein
MKIERFWCVTDPPAQDSELGDVCFEITPRQLVASSIGAFGLGEEQVRIMQSIAIYTDEAEARADALDRLRRRDEDQR